MSTFIANHYIVNEKKIPRKETRQNKVVKIEIVNLVRLYI